MTYKVELFYFGAKEKQVETGFQTRAEAKAYALDLFARSPDEADCWKISEELSNIRRCQNGRGLKTWLMKKRMASFDFVPTSDRCL